MNNKTRFSFDFARFKRAFEAQDVSAWLNFFDEGAEWIEYKHTHPPRAPRRLVGRKEIGDFLGRVTASNVKLTVEGEIVGPDRAAFRVWCELPDGRRIIEQVFIYFTAGRIARQIDVEAWD